LMRQRSTIRGDRSSRCRVTRLKQLFQKRATPRGSRLCIGGSLRASDAMAENPGRLIYSERLAASTTPPGNLADAQAVACHAPKVNLDPEDQVKRYPLGVRPASARKEKLPAVTTSSPAFGPWTSNESGRQRRASPVRSASAPCPGGHVREALKTTGLLWHGPSDIQRLADAAPKADALK
jgi:hypothetical protein